MHESVHEYLSEKGKERIAKRWKATTREERQTSMALPQYTRMVKLYGRDQADTWLISHFGEEKAYEFLESPRFKRQWIKYL